MKYKLTTWIDHDCEFCGTSNMIDSKEENFECGTCHEENDQVKQQ